MTTLDILKERGTPLSRQRFTWREMVQPVYSKVDDDAFSRVRAILMNGVEAEAVRFGHSCARMNRDAQRLLAEVRRIEQHQQTTVNWLNPPDQNPIETTLGFEQVAVEVTAAIAQAEPDKYLKEVYDFGLLEDFDHLYRFSALYDRLCGGDANALIQSYTDLVPGRPTAEQHRAPQDDLRRAYDKTTAHPMTRIHANLILAAEHMTHDYYMVIGPMFADPLARQLYAEIASVEEQHVTQYESIIDASETWHEKWVLHEASEVWAYWSCMQWETNPRMKAVWERFCSYELGHLHLAMEAMREEERRDPEEVLPKSFHKPLPFESQRPYIRSALERGLHLRARGTEFVDLSEESEASISQRDQLNSDGSPSQLVAAGYHYTPGTELALHPPAEINLASVSDRAPRRAPAAPKKGNGHPTKHNARHNGKRKETRR
ncbi:MAG: hypothetical protein H6Q89_5070 [Myxococcaceae bacterium]|nr:hypothetical protein [Myxococcaceae bacterium]